MRRALEDLVDALEIKARSDLWWFFPELQQAKKVLRYRKDQKPWREAK
jgi:hypothetical protein